MFKNGTIFCEKSVPEHLRNVQYFNTGVGFFCSLKPVLCAHMHKSLYMTLNDVV